MRTKSISSHICKIKQIIIGSKTIPKSNCPDTINPQYLLSSIIGDRYEKVKIPILLNIKNTKTDKVLCPILIINSNNRSCMRQGNTYENKIRKV